MTTAEEKKVEKKYRR